MSGDDVTQLREDMRDLRASMKDDIKGIYDKLDTFSVEWRKHLENQTARTSVIEEDCKDLRIADGKLNLRILLCQENAAKNVNDIKKAIAPSVEITNIVIWLKKHWIYSLAGLIIFCFAIFGVITVCGRWPVGQKISEITLGGIWNLIFNHN